MEGGTREDGAGAAMAAGRRWRGAGCGDDEESSHGSSGGGVELSLRLRTGVAADDDDGGGGAAASAPPRATAAEARRNMTIFYNGRVCAVDVTEVQARAIISMASEETLQAADHRRWQRQQLMRDGDGDSSSSSSAAVAWRCARDRGLVRPSAAVALAPSLVAAAGVVGSPRRQGGDAVAAPPVLEIDPAAPTGLSMKRSLQLFLQKRKARTAAAVAPPYAAAAAAAGRQAQAVRR